MSQAHILVVDDEASIRLTLGALLRRSGYTVSTASSGEEAIELLKEQRFDLLLIDLKMPGVDGMAVVRAAQERDPEAVLIILTGHGTLESAMEGVRRDIFDYLLKTSDPQDVLKRVAAGLDQRAQRHERESLVQTLVSTASALRQDVTAPKLPESAKETPQLSGAVSLPNVTAAFGGMDRVIVVGPLRIDPLRHEATLAKQTATLTPTELRVLVCLAQHAGAMLTYSQLVRCAQQYDTFAAEASELIKPHMHHLRQKLEQTPGKPRYLLNVRGMGYMLKLDADD